MNHSRIPRHIVIIMDGNGRWAKKRFLPRYAGHKAGVETVRRVLNFCAEQGVEILTLFAFSSENWRRPQKEVSLLINVRLHIIGAREAFPDNLQKLIVEAEKLTENNAGLTLVIAANYGGHWDILEAAKQLAQKVEQGVTRFIYPYWWGKTDQ